ncbi:FAD-binding monooxygenase [Dictyobacter kobayashii]|uniref:FAD-binding monooxygenase n=1 Tax=Dictyobacter kobayashii TaxID=2014872 RepID=A0A402APK3_9CHLR|nr:FAD-binding monooxygenase [Dictyobacter kobayashii]
MLVIGAGPTGLTMANLLTRSGVKVRILDKKAGPTQETRAIVVHAKILELLDRLDLTDKAFAEGEQLRSAQFFTQGRRTGKLTFLNGNGARRTPYPFGLIYGQDQTEHLLLQSLAETGVLVEWNTELLMLDQNPDGAWARVRVADGSEETIEALWIVGADGAHSPVRHALSLGFEGQTYLQTLFVADLDMEWEAGPRQGGMDMVRQGFFLFIPMHGEGHFRLFGSLPPEMANRDTITLDDVRHLVDTQSGLRVNILKARWISIYRTHQRLAERFRVGRVFLVGDAAHIHSPAGGQGMNTGIGDAFNLAWKLALVVKGEAHDRLLDSYEAERIPFARSILRGSDWGFQILDATRSDLRWFKLFVLPRLFRLISPLPIFQRRVFWLFSQLWTSYRNSPAVAEAESGKREPMAGDRAPYGFFEGGADAGKSIFTKLRDQDHHLFLFEGKRSAQSQTDFPGLEEQVQTLLNEYHVPIHLHALSAENHSLHNLYRADTCTLFLVRPDGHIAYRGKAENLASLRSYLDGLFSKSTNSIRDSATPQVASGS